jgi:hypothetical protein
MGADKNSPKKDELDYTPKSTPNRAHTMENIIAKVT